MQLSRRQIILTIVLTIATIVLLCIYLLFDPAENQWFPQCLFYKLTGLKCAGCGSQRAIHALLSGNLGTAWQHNALLLISIPLIFYMIWLEFMKHKFQRLYTRFYSPTLTWVIISVVVGWTILRNIFGF